MTDKPMDVERTLRELSEKATPGPWKLEEENGEWIRTLAQIDADIICDRPTDATESVEKWADNSAFIVACVNYVREALREPGAEAAPPKLQDAASNLSYALKNTPMLEWQALIENHLSTFAAAGESTELRAALTEMFELIESGELVRDISRDYQPDYHTRMLKLTITLKKAQQALAASQERSATEKK